MRINYVCHACLLIDTGDLKIVTDPWFTGSSYCGQWHLFPKPINQRILQESDVILLSHGHEDHFHERSLIELPKSVRVFYPYSWYGGARQFLNQLGYSKVVEAIQQKRYELNSDTSVTYIVNGMDSIIIVESKGQVLVNINDALHSFPLKIIDMFIEYLNSRWPAIDTLFCGFGGASYFPNTIHCSGKDDVQIGQAREQLFAHNFCRIVHGLKPKVAIPFAADFALLDSQQRWINTIRFQRAHLRLYYERLYGSSPDMPTIQVMYSGDWLVGNELRQRSPYWENARYNDFDRLLDRQYAKEIEERQKGSSISEQEAEALRQDISNNISCRSALFPRARLARLTFGIKVTDLLTNEFMNVEFQAAGPVVHRSETRSPDAILQINISSRILKHSLASDWGGDAITIGYGCDIDVFDQSTITSGLDTVCVRLLTKQPQASRHWRIEPMRVAKHLITSPTTRSWALKSLLGGSGDYSDKKNNDVMRHWMFRSKCEVCCACDLPLLDENFAAKL